MVAQNWRRFGSLVVLTTLAGSCVGRKYTKTLDQIAPPDGEFYRPIQVTAGNESNFAPDLSPNGVFVVYTSDRKGNKDLWEKRTNGGYAQPLTKHSADDFSPVLSPAGKRIAFVSRRADAAGDIHILGLGPSLSKLYGYREGSVSRVENPWTEDGSPAWYPDGEKIVFVARKPGETEGDIMKSELSDLKPVPLSPDTRGNQPSVAPNGKDVVYVNNGAILVYDEDAKRIKKLTDGGLLQDGQPRYSADGKYLYFIRYADDTNLDGQLNGDDRPTIWRLDLEQKAKSRENYYIYPLTSASFAGYSPQIRGSYLYFTLQEGPTLDIFRLPAFGQRRPPEDMDSLHKEIDKRSDYYEKVYLARLAQAHFAAEKKWDECVEAALLEVDTYVQNGRVVETKWAYSRLKDNFKDRTGHLALADLALIQLEHEPYAYPRHQSEPDRDTLVLLDRLDRRIAAVEEKFANQDDRMARRVQGRAKLVRAKILAARRDFFRANEISSEIPLTYSDDRRLSAEGAYFSALIAPAISNRATAVTALRRVVQTYPDQRNIVRQAAAEAVRLTTEKDNYIEDLVALRSASAGLPVMPALAHMRIADDYLKEGKKAVAANELRQIVESYPQSPEVLLAAAARLSRMDEEAGRYAAAEKMLQTLNKSLEKASPEKRVEARHLLIRFWLRRGEAMLGEGRRDAAVVQFNKVTAIEPLNVSAHRGIIDATYGTPQFEGLVDKYEDEAADDEDSAEKVYFKGYAETYDIDQSESILAKLKNINDAIKTVAAARELNGQIIYIHQTLGWLYLQRGFWGEKFHREGGILGELALNWGLFEGFLGFPDPNWMELAVDSFLSAYYLADKGSLEQAWLAQNLGQTYYELKNFQKALTYYMERIRLLPVIPTRDKRVEAVIWRRAGRSAFQSDELELAEALQRRALGVWEALASDKDIAYSLDALALTLQERGLCREAMDLYDRLAAVARRQKNFGNEAAALANLGFCAFKDGDYTASLEYMKQADEAAQVAIDNMDEDEIDSEDGAIVVDLGGQSSAAGGFDVRMRQIMAATFRARAYERLQRRDLALVELRRKLELLIKYRAFLMEFKDSPKEVMAEQISVTRNNIARLEIGSGNSVVAGKEFSLAAAEAQKIRQETQEYESRAEWINRVNFARVQLRLAHLGLLDQNELRQTITDVQGTQQRLWPIVDSGSEAEVPAIAQLGAIEASLRQFLEDPVPPEGSQEEPEEAKAAPIITADAQWRERLAHSIEMAKRADAERYEKGALLASLNADPNQGAATRRIREKIDEDPELEWKYFAARGQWPEAVASLRGYVAAGNVMQTASDRLTARLVYESWLETLGSEDEVIAWFHDYAATRTADIGLRTLLAVKESGTQKWLAGLIEDRNADVAKTLRDGEAALLLHRTLGGRYLAILKTPDETHVLDETPSSSKGVWGRLLGKWQPLLALPEEAKTLYVIPIGDLYKVGWETIKIGEKPMGSLFSLAYLPAPQLLSSYARKAQVAMGILGLLQEKASVNTMAAEVVADNKPQETESAEQEVAAGKQHPPERTLAHAKLAQSKDLLTQLRELGNRDILLIETDKANLQQELNQHDLVHIGTPVAINDIEPANSVVYASLPADFTKYQQDLTMKKLADTDMEYLGLMVIEQIRYDDQLPRNKGEGYDGWVGLSLAGLRGGLPTIVIAEDKYRQQNERHWPKFYEVLGKVSAASAVAQAKLRARTIGFAGYNLEQAEEIAEENLEDLEEEAEDAFYEAEYVDAINAYRSVIEYARISDDEDILISAFDSMTKAQFSLRQYLDALRYQQKITAHRKKGLESGDVDAFEYAESELDAAILAVRGEDYETADRHLDVAEKIFVEEDDDAFLGKVYVYRGINLQNQKDYEGTVKAYQKSYEYYKEEDEMLAAARLLDIGNVYASHLNDYTQAIEFYDKAAEVFEEEDETEALVRVLIDKANANISLGQLQQAIFIIERDILPEIDEEDDPITWIRAKQILANAYFRAGQYQEARDLNTEALDVIEDIESEANRAVWEIDARSLRGLILAKFKKYDEAIEEFRAAVGIAAKFDLKSKISLLYNNYGFVAREFGYVDLSIELFNEALKIDTELKSRTSIAFDRRNLGLSVFLKGDVSRAESLLERALETSKELGLTYNLVYCHFGLGDTALKREDWESAAKHFQAALDNSLTGNMRDFVWRAHSGLGVTKMRAGEAQAAEEHFLESTKVIEELSAGLKTEDSRAAFQSDRGVREVYDDYIALLFEAKRYPEAWQLAQRSRSRLYVDTIGKEKLELATEEDRRLAENIRDSRSKLDLAARALGRVSKKNAEKRKRRYETRKQALDAALTDAGKKNPFLESLLGVQEFKLDEFRSTLGEGVAVLEFYQTSEHIFTWLHTSAGMKASRQEIAESKMVQSVAEFRSLMENFSTTDYLGEEIAKVLIEPALTGLKDIRRLVVIPHKQLHFLPFAALPWNRGQLIDSFSIVYADSASDMQALMQQPARTIDLGSRLAIFANPARTDDETLVFAEKEARAIKRYYSGAQLYLGAEATKSQLVAQTADTQVLHVASHGDFDPITPIDSHLKLSTSAGGNGNLSVRDVYGLQVAAPMVTLSACESGVGELSTGEEVIGLRRSFHYAGASTVVSTLWRISDVASAMLMKRFYRYLSEGDAKDVALIKAQMTVRQYFSHPAYWSGYKINGDYR